LPTEQIILETTGLANPGAVADALDDLSDLVRPGLRISLVDMLDGDKFISGGPVGLAGDQIRHAGVLVCNKADAVSPEHLAGVTQILKNMNPGAVIFNASYGRIPFGELDRLLERFSGSGSKAAAAFRPKTVRHTTHQDEGYASLTLEVTRPMAAEDLAALVRLVGDRTPRIKGIIDSVEEGRPMIVQYAAGALALEVPLSPPDSARFLVLIGKGFDTAFTESLSRIPGLALQMS
jgi:G3E family GTPase